MTYRLDWKVFIYFYYQMTSYCSGTEALAILKEIYGVPTR